MVGSTVGSSKAQSHGNVVRLLVGSGPAEQACLLVGPCTVAHGAGAGDVDILGSSSCALTLGVELLGA